jgi:hypothetical protein
MGSLALQQLPRTAAEDPRGPARSVKLERPHAASQDGGPPGSLNARRLSDSVVMIASREAMLTICHVLRDDPDLAEALPPELRERAVDECIAPAVRLRRGRWSGHVK